MLAFLFLCGLLFCVNTTLVPPGVFESFISTKIDFSFLFSNQFDSSASANNHKETMLTYNLLNEPCQDICIHLKNIISVFMIKYLLTLLLTL